MKITEIAENIKKVKTKVDYSIEIQADIAICDMSRYIYLKTPSTSIKIYIKDFNGYKGKDNSYTSVNYSLTVDEPGTYSLNKGNCYDVSSDSVTLSPDQPQGVITGYIYGEYGLIV